MMATYYAVTNKTGSHIQVNELNGQLEIYENEALAKAEIKDGFKITKIEVTKSDSESENPLAKREYKICYVEGSCGRCAREIDKGARIMRKSYDFEPFRISTKDGDKYVPGITAEWCSGLAVTMVGFGRFTITHTPSGYRVCNGNYERCDMAILDMARLSAIAKSYGFSWSDEKPQDQIKAILDMPVPFDGATITDNDGERPMPIGRFIQSLRPCVPFRDIDSPLWEDERPIDEAERILSAMNGDEES